MKPLVIDFETQSEINIKKAGSYKYVQGTHFRPVCMAYSFLDEDDIHLWTIDEPFPYKTVRSNTLIAFNCEFEYNVLKSKWFEWNDYDFSYLTHNHFIDVQAIARSFGFPAALDKLAKALGLKINKDAAGTRLINKLCVIKNNKVPTPRSHSKDFRDLFNYCIQDVRVTKECMDMLVKKDLSEFERDVFAHMLEQNAFGLPIDVESVVCILNKMKDFKAICNREISKLTHGVVTKGTQVQRIVKYLRKFNIITSSIDKDHITALLEKDIHPKAKRILELRQLMSHSSTAKYERLLEMVERDNRVRGNLKYYGGHTGRFGGIGFQAHNLPSAQFDEPEGVIKDFREKSVHQLISQYVNVGEAASKLIRPMIKAPQGYKLMVVDYKSIENCVLHWIANDKRTLKEFEQGLDQYITYASRRFNVPYNEVTKEMRTYAKPCILGLGFGGGGSALQFVASGYGLELSNEEAEADKKFYRALFPMIPELWYRVNDAILTAVHNETITEVKTGTVTLRFIKRGTYAFILLPSGRFLSYPAPLIQRDSKYDNPCFTYMGESNKQWRRLGDQYRMINGIPAPEMPIHGGRLVENIVQATARDILVHGMLKARDAGFNKQILSVHDEAVAEIHENSVRPNTLDKYIEALCTIPPWAKGLPLTADGYIGERYRKD